MKKFGDWRRKAYYRLTEQKAVYYAWSDSDFHEGGTNSKGYRMSAKMTLRKGVGLGYSFFDTKNERGGIDGSHLDIPGIHMFDLNFKF